MLATGSAQRNDRNPGSAKRYAGRRGAPLDFLLECIGFPPDFSMEELVELVRRKGEPAAWRGQPDRHMRLSLGGGLEVRIDRESGRGPWNVLPHFQVPHRLRVAVDEIRPLPDSPFDALVIGWAAPSLDPDEARLLPGAYRLSAFVADARRLPRSLPFGHVLALSIAGFALDVTAIHPDEGDLDPEIRASRTRSRIAPLGAPGDPGGCADVSLRIRKVLRLVNPITNLPVEILEADAPERPLPLFVSRWQIERDRLELPRPGWRIDGTFLFSGRIAGGLPGPAAAARGSFG
jgi:hypothetical protein